MQNKGAIYTFTILLTLVCIYQLSFTYKAQKVESNAAKYAKGNPAKETAYIDSIAGEVVYNFMGLKKFTYKDVKELEMNLGLDLKGGMNATLEVSVVDLIRSLSNYSTDSTFNKALVRAKVLQESNTDDFVTLFGRAFSEIDPNARLSAIFNTVELKDRVQFNSSNADVIKIIRQETDAAIDNAFNIISTRIDRFGVMQPNIQQLQTKGRILVELPGIKNPERVKKLLQGTATLEFWETYDNQDAYTYLLQANAKIKEIEPAITPAGNSEAKNADGKTSADTTSKSSLLDKLEAETKDSTSALDNLDNIRKEYPLFAVLTPSTNQQGGLFPGPIIGTSHFKDTAKVNSYLNNPVIKTIFPKNMIFRWGAIPIDKAGNYYRLFALRATTRDGRAPLTGDVITDARQDYDQLGSNPEVAFSMNSEGAKTWQRITKENIGKSVAIVLDGYVRSFPNVLVEITGGRSSITGLESVEEAKDLANILKSGKMPAPANIIEDQIVGPSLGQKAINSGFISFAIAFLLVLVYMLFFYSSKAGMAANVALLFNVFFLIGVLASLGAILTLPGIAGIVLTMGMAVDANVLIYERIHEEIAAGKSPKLAISDGYRHAYSAIIDGQVTTLLTGIILYIFGSGPIKGFATTLNIGILTSLFTSIFISRLIFEWQLSRNKKITFVTKLTENWLRHTNVKFIDMRKTFYIFSGSLIILSIGSIFIHGFDLGIDFKGGRTYVVKFDQEVSVEAVRGTLEKAYGTMPLVKTFGPNNQVKITTGYRIDETNENVDNEVEAITLKGLQAANLIPTTVDIAKFHEKYRQSAQKVGPTISVDIRKSAALSIFFALLAIFLYIVIRFRNWEFATGAVIALGHDSFITIGMFSLLWGFLPFSLEIDQAFIAAILTIIGYSINDTVIVFDRIREYKKLYPKRETKVVLDDAINHTLRRTFSTSLTVLVVLFAIFIFGGETIRGFCFALIIGVGFGTYSSVFVATTLAYDVQNFMERRKLRKAK
jgi:SecD/SecF fusion protein